MDMESGIIYCFWRCSCLCHKRIWMDYLFHIYMDMESGIIYCFWWCSCLCHKRIWMDYLFHIHIFHPGSPTIQCFLVVSHKKYIYFLRMGGWPSLKTERRRQKWTSDMESGIIYCFWLCSCLCHKRILMDYLFQI